MQDVFFKYISTLGYEIRLPNHFWVWDVGTFWNTDPSYTTEFTNKHSTIQGFMQNTQFAWFSCCTQIVSWVSSAIPGIFLHKVGKSEVWKGGSWLGKAPVLSSFELHETIKFPEVLSPKQLLLSSEMETWLEILCKIILILLYAVHFLQPSR